AFHLAVVFERRRKALALPADQQGRLEVPAVLRAGPVQGALEDRIEDDLPTGSLAVENRPQFDPSRVLLVACVLEGELGDKSDPYRQGPGFREIEVGEDAPAREFQGVA